MSNVPFFQEPDLHDTPFPGAGWDRDGIVPNPGSAGALAQGCICPVIDNSHGRGYRDYPGKVPREWLTVGDCPLHGGAA